MDIGCPLQVSVPIKFVVAPISPTSRLVSVLRQMHAGVIDPRHEKEQPRVILCPQ